MSNTAEQAASIALPMIPGVVLAYLAGESPDSYLRARDAAIAGGSGAAFVGGLSMALVSWFNQEDDPLLLTAMVAVVSAVAGAVIGAAASLTRDALREERPWWQRW